MQKSWMTKFLPKDEYRAQQIVFFMAEAAISLVVLSFFYSILHYFVFELAVTGGGIALLVFLFLISYITIRSISAGIEYPEVATQTRFKQEKRAKKFSSLIFGIVFLLGQIIFNTFPSSGAEAFKLLATAIIAACFFYLFQYISLKRSYKKNKALLDD